MSARNTFTQAPLVCPFCSAERATQIGGNPDGSNAEGRDFACGSFWLRAAPELYQSAKCKVASAKQRSASLNPALPLPSPIA